MVFNFRKVVSTDNKKSGVCADVLACSVHELRVPMNWLGPGLLAFNTFCSVTMTSCVEHSRAAQKLGDHTRNVQVRSVCVISVHFYRCLPYYAVGCRGSALGCELRQRCSR